MSYRFPRHTDIYKSRLCICRLGLHKNGRLGGEVYLLLMHQLTASSLWAVSGPFLLHNLEGTIRQGTPFSRAYNFLADTTMEKPTLKIHLGMTAQKVNSHFIVSHWKCCEFGVPCIISCSGGNITCVWMLMEHFQQLSLFANARLSLSCKVFELELFKL